MARVEIAELLYDERAEADLFALLTLAAHQAGVPLLEWVKTVAREQALRTLETEQASGRRAADTGERPR